MNICKYCKDKNMNKQEYLQFKSNIQATAQAIKSQLQYNNGLYYPTNNILHYKDTDIKYFIIQELKNLNIEFINDNTLYRVTE